ncbi:Hpt domain-containing protein [Paracoccus aerodenitrificans]|uniref:Hpt domain-containing protein n=1 Tax=Paracoccus aerodenitrificans TaxID=3017781 RepID=UPI0022F11983|nr:Hpt domain-containing protein [Paracoccus aerodenitrificans]WBU63934.1 Hpt domain-containing protein [Paracoccus aerodenitrificans]
MIDWIRVQTLQEELGEADFPPVVELFLDEIESTVMRLRHSDPDQLESDLHFLKGCAGNLGFRKFRELCVRGEAQLREGGSDQVDLGAVLDCYAATKKEFVGRMPGRYSGVA